MKNVARYAALAGLVTGSLISTAAVAAADPPPPPQNVAVAWDTTPERVLVTWSAPGNDFVEVKVFFADGSPSSTFTKYDSDNDGRTILAKTDFATDAVLKIGVRAHYPVTNDFSEWVYSASFDTDIAPRPIITGAARSGVEDVLVTWRAGELQEDATPGDPLDRPDTVTYRPSGQSDNGPYRKGATTGGLSGVVPFYLTASPAGLILGVTVTSDWGSADAGIFRAARNAARLPSIPATVAYGLPTVITGLVKRYDWLETNDPNAAVVLYARTDSASPWYVVNSTRSDSTGRYRFSVPASGTRQYRLVTPDVPGATPTFGFSWDAARVTTTYRLLSARFTDNTATYGQKVTASLRVAPAAAPLATLQRWNGTTWAGVKQVRLSQGAGSYTFTATQRGTTSYRFIVPNTTYAGRPIAGIVTGTFYLTTR